MPANWTVCEVCGAVVADARIHNAWHVRNHDTETPNA